MPNLAHKRTTRQCHTRAKGCANTHRRQRLNDDLPLRLSAARAPERNAPAMMNPVDSPTAHPHLGRSHASGSSGKGHSGSPGLPAHSGRPSGNDGGFTASRAAGPQCRHRSVLPLDAVHCLQHPHICSAGRRPQGQGQAPMRPETAPFRNPEHGRHSRLTMFPQSFVPRNTWNPVRRASSIAFPSPPSQERPLPTSIDTTPVQYPARATSPVAHCAYESSSCSPPAYHEPATKET